MTQHDLADAAGVDLKTVYNLESGTRCPIARTRAAIAAALGWEPDALNGIEVGVSPVPRNPPSPRRDLDFGAGIPPEELAPHVADIEQAAYRALVDLAGAELPGPDDPDVRETMFSLPGKAVFPENEHDQRTWDSPVYSPEERVVFMARLRVLRARAVKEQRQRRAGAGLTGHIPASGAIPALISVGGKAYRASS